MERMTDYLKRLIAILLLTSWGSGAAFGGTIKDFFVCLEAKGATIASAHRGGPGPGLPENALETLQRGYQAGLRHFEVDVTNSSDGVLYLMHDRTLERTTTGNGSASSLPWSQIKELRLKDNNGTVTDFYPPPLTRVLAWAVTHHAQLSLDFKGATQVTDLVEAVSKAEASGHVLYLANDLERAAAILALQPDAMVSISVNSRQTPAQIEASALPKANQLLWTGFRNFDDALVKQLDEAGYYVSFGTLGFGDSYDDRFAAANDNSLYAELAGKGVHLLATDRPLAVRDGLITQGQSWDSEPQCIP